MRPWMIVLSSAIGAIAVIAGLALPDLLNASRSEIGPTFLLHLPALAVAGFGAYALGAMLLTTATLLAGVLQVRHHFETTGSSGDASQRDWLVALGSGGFRQLAARLSAVPVQSAKPDGGIVLETDFSVNEIRSEIARLQYISLARSHFFSALIMLAGVVALGLVQDLGPLPFLLSAIPTASTVLVLVGVVLLAILGGIAIDVTAEPLLETISQQPAERVEVRLLRRAVELLEAAHTAQASDETAPASRPAWPERLVAVVEQAHRGLLDAVENLSANTQSLGVIVRSSVETLETTMRTIAAQQPVVGGNGAPDAAGLLELQSTVAELTAALQRLSAPSEEDFESRPPGDPGAPHRRPAPRVARELRKLLQEIEAAR